MTRLDPTYATCLAGSLRDPWTVEGCFAGRDFDFTKPFLPERLAGVVDIGCLSGEEKLLLNHIRGHSYCHLFAFVEEFIVPLVMDRARADVYGDETRVWSLLRFAEEELKHQQMLRRACGQIQAGLGATCGAVAGEAAVADAVLGAPSLAALLLTNMIEWFTQLHYQEHVRHDGQLDELFRDILRFHWIDEARHARLDTLLIDEIAAETNPAQVEQALDSLLDLGGAVDGLLDQQIELDLDSLQRAANRTLNHAQCDEIRAHQRHAYRWTFLVSGLQHPQFVALVGRLSPAGAARIAAAAQALSA
jgi:hypothetical protein